MKTLAGNCAYPRVSPFDATVAILFCSGVLAAAYHLYDVAFPNRFVGDMYGYEVLSRMLVQTLAAGAMLAGGVLWIAGRKEQSRGLRLWGGMIVAIPALLLIVMGVDVSRSRHWAEIRKEYPKKTIEELMRIAREEKEISALDAIAMKRDARSADALREILLDESVAVRLRIVAAQNIGQLGGRKAQTALEEAQRQRLDQHLRQAVDYALETVKTGLDRPADKTP